MKIPEISIIIPVYKSEQHLYKCLNSIKSQTFTDYEVILVDDGSPDKSGKICDIFCHNDTRFKVIHKNNEGVSKARNTGLKYAKGNWITFIDSDDWIDSQYLETYFQGNMADIVFQGISKEGENINTMKYNKIPSGNFIQDLIYIEKNNLLGWSCNKIIKREIIHKNNIEFPTNISLREDSIFFLTCLQYTQSISWRDVALYHYIENPQSLTFKLHTYQELNNCNEQIYILRKKISEKFLNKSYFEFSKLTYQTYKILHIKFAYFSQSKLNYRKRTKILKESQTIKTHQTLGYTDKIIYSILKTKCHLSIKDFFINIISNIYKYKHYKK